MVAKSRSIRLKLTAVFLTVALLAIIFSIAAITAEIETAKRAALLEAQDVANAITTATAEDFLAPSLLQAHLMDLHRLYKRDLFFVDMKKRIIADSDPQEIGVIFSADQAGEVSDTLRDGHTRTFIEDDATLDHPTKQIVLPIHENRTDTNSAIIGGVVLEYTPIYDQLMLRARGQIYLTVGTAFLFVLLTILLWKHASTLILRPLSELKRGVDMLGAQDYATRVVVEADDEIGALAKAFNRMAEDLSVSHAKLIEYGRGLEMQVVARTRELSNTNILLQEEIEQHKLAARRIEYLAYYDSMTTLPNRSMFGKLLAQGLANARRNKKQLAVLFLDLDRFKNVNDTLGHDAGDALLQEVAKRLKDSLRGNDTVARLGGDEFVVLLPELDDGKQAETVARKLLSIITKPFSVYDHELRITASIGISTYPKDGEDEQTLTKNADIAMYQAKDEGKNNFQFYSTQFNAHSFERLALESSLRRALERDEFQLYYQARRNLRTGQIPGMEALLRWKHPDLGMVSPVQFIPVAEETGLIVPIGAWVLKAACQQNVAWQKMGLPRLTMAVNLSARQFNDANLLRNIQNTLKETGMEPTLLELEITESMLMHDVERTLQVLTDIKKMGILLAIDDFGTGYSSLSNLKQFPVDTIKIDRSFIRDTPGDPEDKAIAEAIIAMSKTLSLSVIAEGVETKEQVDFLREHACDEIQGFYFNKPMPPDDFAEFLKTKLTENAMEPAPSNHH
ncbi:MAG TPA: EAL domain-containing protein [Burkholderiales bacterium]|nr:EAL domain-containing protein [Burkholderiales bacterium]